MSALFPTPAAGFDHPIDILDGCHERILRTCSTIERIAAHLESTGADADAGIAAKGVIRYFDTAGADHHRDEEEDLFPTIVHHVPSLELNAVFALFAKLRADHRKLEGLWTEMRHRLLEVTKGREGGLTPAIARTFAEAYERHIALEESQLLPIARRVLDPVLAAAIGNRMARRRGVTPGAN
jgi:hemerythrin-like domain-containing protein